MFETVKFGIVVFVTVCWCIKHGICVPIAEPDGGDADEDEFAHLPEILRKRSTPTNSPEALANFGINEDDAMEYVFKANEDIIRSNSDLNGVMLEGDIYLGPRAHHNALKDVDKLWPGGIIYYTIDKYYDKDANQRIQAAIGHFEELTCIEFRKREDERNYIHFVPLQGCWSSVGRDGGKQEISLGFGCTEHLGTIMHEMMHAMGFYHEQSRTDRDKYVTIVWENIFPKMEENFEKYGHQTIDDLGSPYDYTSIMHYPKDAFSKNDGDTIIPKKNDAEIECKDDNKLCSTWANKCDRDPWMQTKCKKTCNLCTEDCVDTNERCASWAADGECQANPTYMLENCKQSCAECPSSVVPADCIDHNDMCDDWARRGECVKNPNYMHSSCKRSCGKCSAYTKVCLDENELCGWWASDDECRNNPGYMNVNCKKSCNQC
uniref:Metalloendopeptidase n=1 Tax=Saccoglossus kowalevskii TaxID=10224 RepID=A0ABM0MIF2_SACKO|nr:PREDICTED: zinc metalloproteinase nas-15-like [Saccoglossus kowalevskii]